jgi:hypothetical protein
MVHSICEWLTHLALGFQQFPTPTYQVQTAYSAQKTEEKGGVWVFRRRNGGWKF